jgi:hypothetical protein
MSNVYQYVSNEYDGDAVMEPDNTIDEDTEILEIAAIKLATIASSLYSKKRNQKELQLHEDTHNSRKRMRGSGGGATNKLNELGEHIFIHHGKNGYYAANIVVHDDKEGDNLTKVDDDTGETYVYIQWDSTRTREFVPMENIDWITRDVTNRHQRESPTSVAIPTRSRHARKESDDNQAFYKAEKSNFKFLHNAGNTLRKRSQRRIKHNVVTPNVEKDILVDDSTQPTATVAVDVNTVVTSTEGSGGNSSLILDPTVKRAKRTTTPLTSTVMSTPATTAVVSIWKKKSNTSNNNVMSSEHPKSTTVTDTDATVELSRRCCSRLFWFKQMVKGSCT